MSTLRISNIEAKSVPASATIDEKVKITNSSGDVLVFLDGKTSGITTVGINTTDGNITFDANSNVVVTGIITATKFVGTIEPTNLTVGGDLTIPDKIIHTGDTDTAIRFPAADTITAETGGGERVRITSNGKLHIGGLTTNNTGGYASVIATGGANNNGGFQAHYNAGAYGGGSMTTVAADGGGLDFWTYTGNIGSESYSRRLRIDSAGRLLVNTTTTYVSNQIMIVKGASPSAGGNRPYDGQLAIENSETTGAINTGGVLAFIGHSGAGSRGFGSIRCLKEDGTSGNYGSYMSFETRTNGSAPAEKLRITSAGDMGLGVTDATILNDSGFRELTIGGASEGAGLHLKDNNGNVQGGLFTSDNTGAMIIRTITNHPMMFRTNNVQRFRLDTSGNANIIDGNLIVASGHGIDFSATADAPFGNTSNEQELLDDYEEGQWLPVYSANNGAGSVSYSYRKGYYIKIGAQVTVWIEMTISSASGMSGVAQISNLPFNKNDLGGVGNDQGSSTQTYYYSGTTNWYIQNHAQGKPIFTGWMPNNSNLIRIYNANHWGSVTNAPINTTGRMSFSYTYTSSA